MGFVSLLGHFLIGVGPSLVFYIYFLARRSFLVLVTLASTFYYLTVLLFISAIFRGFAPLPASAAYRVGVLIVSVTIEQGARYLLWIAHRMTTNTLSDAARKTGRTWTTLDELSVALGFGFGQGAAHTVFFFLAVLPVLAEDATYYLDSCPQMSYFLSLALLELAFTFLHACSTVVFFSGLNEASRSPKTWAPPLLHLAASLCTVFNFVDGGCVGVATVLLIFAIHSTIWAGRVTMHKNRHRTGLIELSR